MPWIRHRSGKGRGMGNLLYILIVILVILAIIYLVQRIR
jgi:uncharacterized membrane protein